MTEPNDPESNQKEHSPPPVPTWEALRQARDRGTLAEVERLLDLVPGARIVEETVRGHTARVLQLLDAGESVNTEDQPFSSALQLSLLEHAISSEHHELAETLLDRGATPTLRTLTVLRASTPDPMIARLVSTGLAFDDTASTVALRLFRFETTQAGREALLRKLVAHGFTLSTETLWWTFVELRNSHVRTDALPMLELHLELGAKVEPNLKLRGESLMDLALAALPFEVLERLVGLGGKLSASRKVPAGAFEREAKNQWLASRSVASVKRLTPTEFLALRAEELTDDLIVSNVVGAELFPDRQAWQPDESDSSEIVVNHVLWRHGDQLKYEVRFPELNVDGEAESRARGLYTRLFEALTRLHGKVKKGAKRTAWPDVRAELWLTRRKAKASDSDPGSFGVALGFISNTEDGPDYGAFR